MQVQWKLWNHVFMWQKYQVWEKVGKTGTIIAQKFQTLGILYILPNLTLLTASWSSMTYHSDFMDEETEAEKDGW